MIIPEFTGGRDQDVAGWLGLVEKVCLKRPMGDKDWVDVGYYALSENVTKILTGIEDDLNKLTSEKWEWTWNAFKMALIGIEKQVKESRSALEKLDDLRRKYPKTFMGVGVGLIGVAAIPLAPAALVGGLNLIGFSSAGPVAGSIAASVQSAVYGGAVASGSAFALAQSAAMGGVAVASASSLTAGAGAAAVGTWLQVSKPNDPPSDAWPVTLRASNDLLLALLHERRKKE